MGYSRRLVATAPLLPTTSTTATAISTAAVTTTTTTTALLYYSINTTTTTTTAATPIDTATINIHTTTATTNTTPILLQLILRLCRMRTERGGVERHGRHNNEPGSVALARCDYLLLRVFDLNTR